MAKKPAVKPESNGSGVLSKLKAIYGFMTENQLDTLELDEAGTHVKMVRRKAVSQVPVPVPVMSAGAVSHAPAGATSAPQPEAVQGLTIKSSMMGIFYRAPTPSSPPFVKDGEQVKPGQVLCMVEAMKVFNEIKAEYACTVVKVLVDNGKPVKAGQDLIVVQRA
jgi:acetyl-CoA carboxylase biotin carboxyl carrier protein